MAIFIESPNGEWLSDPEIPGPALTRNPDKAWVFEPEAPEVTMARKLDQELMFGASVYELKSPDANNILTMFQKEGLMEDFKITSHDFRPMTNLPGDIKAGLVMDLNHSIYIKDSNGDLYIITTKITPIKQYTRTVDLTTL